MERDISPEGLARELTSAVSISPLVGDCFTGARTPPALANGMGRLFGGQVVAQALAAAQATVPEDRQVHSLHANFLRMGDIGEPVTYEVARELDGGSFSARRVRAMQYGKPILGLSASFTRDNDGPAHEQPMPDVPAPEDLPCDYEQRQRTLDRFPPERRAAFSVKRPIEQRTVEGRHYMDTHPAPALLHTWMRVGGPLGGASALHRAALAYMSDMLMMPTAVLPHGVSSMTGTLIEASLDHAVWFHDDFAADEWLLFRTESDWVGKGRGLIRGLVWSRDGRLVASLMQEGMLRLPRPR